MNVPDIEKRIDDGRQVVQQILRAGRYSFQDMPPSGLPETPGLYVITIERGEIVRIGRTHKQTPRDRIYRNHLMGSQKGNLPSQLVDAGLCSDLVDAKRWIREHCAVQFLQKADLDSLDVETKWAEHFLLSVLPPRFSD